MGNKEFKHIVRIANTDLDGNKSIYHALRKVKGINFMFSHMVCALAGIDKHKKAGYLSEEEINRISEVIKNPLKFGAPEYMLNRRFDYTTGESTHLIGGDLKFTVESDIKRMKMIKCYRGIRHALGLPVRGQRTRSNFRKNKGKVLGVQRRKGTKSGKV